MIFDQPAAPQDALDFLNKVIVPSPLSSREWQDVPAELRARAFFSSRVENAQFLQNAQDHIREFLANSRDDVGALKTGGRAKFVNDMQKWLAENGVVRQGGPGSPGSLTDITSQPRLSLIFNTQVQQAFAYGHRKQGMDPDVLNEFPAQRFIRVKSVKEPRLNHAEFQGKVFLKTDPIWYRVINTDFGVPWGPWGWGCGHDVEDVDRDEAEALGLVRPGEVLVPDKRWDFNSGLQASIKNLGADLVAWLQQVFGDRIQIEGDTMRWVDDQARPSAQRISPSPLPSPPGEGEPSAVTVPAEATPGEGTAVSDAINLGVRGSLADQVNMALKAIDAVHDDGVLPDIDLESTRRSALGLMESRMTATGFAAERILVRQTGQWPALTTVHEIGHFLDLEGMGSKGSFATVSGYADMRNVLDAANQSAAIQGLRTRLAGSASVENRRYLKYLLDPREIWARAYAQFIADRSGFPALQSQLEWSVKGEQYRQWSPDDFRPVAAAIEAMFKNLGWM